MTDIKKSYKSLKKKYKLPNFDELDKYFEIAGIEEETFLLREIRKKIAEKLEFFSKSLEGALQPETTLTQLYEAKFFSEEEKESMFKLYKAIMIAHRQALLLSIENDEKHDAEFVNSFFGQWPKIKEQLNTFFKKMKTGWEKETNINEDLEYLG